mgnify:CR=1 FL=1
MTSELSDEIKSPIQCGYTSPRTISQHSSSPYHKIKESKETYIAFVNAVKDSLNIHLDIYWPASVSEKYKEAMKYQYTFISEELDEHENTRTSFHCHLRGIEIISDEDYSSNSKIVYNFLMQNIIKQGGWVLVSVGDIDIYQRILVNIFNVVTRKSINKEILQLVSPRTNKKIAKEYIRQTSGKKQFVANKKEFHYVR